MIRFVWSTSITDHQPPTTNARIRRVERRPGRDSPTGIEDRYLAYAEAFEESYVDNDGSRIAQYFIEVPKGHVRVDGGKRSQAGELNL
jgi:hypothetical protein